MYVILNSGNKGFTDRELFKIVHFGLQDTSPAFHRSIVKTSADTAQTDESTDRPIIIKSANSFTLNGNMMLMDNVEGKDDGEKLLQSKTDTIFTS